MTRRQGSSWCGEGRHPTDSRTRSRTTPPMTNTTDVPAFVDKWRDNARRESDAREHFIDLCRLVGAAGAIAAITVAILRLT